MKPIPPFDLTQGWSPEQLLATYDFCSLMREKLWYHHQQTLIDEMIKRDRGNGFDLFNNASEYNLELPFDDDVDS